MYTITCLSFVFSYITYVKAHTVAYHKVFLSLSLSLSLSLESVTCNININIKVSSSMSQSCPHIILEGKNNVSTRKQDTRSHIYTHKEAIVSVRSSIHPLESTLRYNTSHIPSFTTKPIYFPPYTPHITCVSSSSSLAFILLPTELLVDVLTFLLLCLLFYPHLFQYRTCTFLYTVFIIISWTYIYIYILSLPI